MVDDLSVVVKQGEHSEHCHQYVSIRQYIQLPPATKWRIVNLDQIRETLCLRRDKYMENVVLLRSPRGGVYRGWTAPPWFQ
jgi:hypothetical protein